MLKRLSLMVAFAALIFAVTYHAQNRGQTPAPAAAPRTPNVPRMANGRPNLTGLWQALGTAYWDIRDHSAQNGPFYQLGSTGAMPAGTGIVEGGDIPYKPE